MTVLHFLDLMLHYLKLYKGEGLQKENIKSASLAATIKTLFF